VRPSRSLENIRDAEFSRSSFDNVTTPSNLVMNFTIEFFRTRPSDEAHATLDRISIVADNLDAASVKAKSLFDTLDMPQKPDGLRILDQVNRELFVWKPIDDDA
jgi:hypothetical protein